MATDALDFNLLTDPWIGVRSRDGTVIEVGILDLLARAGDLTEIVDESPLVIFATWRLLTAVTMQTVALDQLDDLLEWFDRGAFDPTALERLAADWADRFRLFDPVRPFYQSGDIPLGQPPKDAKTVGYLLPELSTGSSVIHFQHQGDDEHALCGVCCAKGLLTQSAFATAGGAGIKAGLAGVPPVYLLPTGESVFATLLLNYLLPGSARPETLNPADPGPLWAQASGVVPKSREVTRVGLLEALTWAPRRVRLFPSDPGRCSRCGREAVLVRQIVFQQGYSLSKEVAWVEPWAAYRGKADKSGEVIPVRPRDDRELWRDFPDLVLQHAEPPYILRQRLAVNEYAPELGLGRLCGLAAFGVRTDMKAKLFEWRHDQFGFVPELLDHELAADCVRQALAIAEETARLLRSAIGRLHPIASRDNPDRTALRAALAAAARLATGHYWHAIAEPFRQLLADRDLLGDDASRARVELTWHQQLRAAATAAFEQAVAGVGVKDADSYRREARANGLLHGWMHKNLLREETPDERETAAVG